MTERLIPFDLEEWRKRPQDLRSCDGIHALGSCEAMGGMVVHWEGDVAPTYHYNLELRALRLTAPAPKRVEVRAALWTSGRFTLWFKDFNIAETDDQFVRWLTNWHIKDGKVFVEVE